MNLLSYIAIFHWSVTTTPNIANLTVTTDSISRWQFCTSHLSPSQDI